MLIERYQYPSLKRIQSEQGRKYCTPDGGRLPSVTTILDKTTDKTFLHQWRRRVGDAEADRITKTSLSLGSEMHEMLEHYVLEGRKPTGRPLSTIMANQIIQHGLCDMDEVWAMEAPLWNPGLYAGTTDCVGVWRGKPAIVDFKNSRKAKKKDWIGNYLEQLAAYGLAHNQVYGTDIHTGVIMLCTQEGEYQQFVLEGSEWQSVSKKWAHRVELYYDSLINSTQETPETP